MLGASLRYILIGYSGHGLVVGEAMKLAGLEILGYTEKQPKENNLLGFDFLGSEDDLFIESNMRFCLGIGNNFLRSDISTSLEARGGKLSTVIHPEASISAFVKLGVGSFVARNSSINPGSTIGKNVIINTGAIIEHECAINDNVHVAPGAVLCGNVYVGRNSFIGANSVVKQGIVIGDNVTIGAGTVVTRSILSHKTVYGNPGRDKI